VRENGVCTHTLQTHFACPPASPTRAPRMHKSHRRKEQCLSAMIGGAEWGRGVRAGWGRRECAHSPCTLTLLALPLSPRALPECARYRRKDQGLSAMIGGAGWGVWGSAEGRLAPPQGAIEKTRFSIVTKRAPNLKAYNQLPI